MTNTLQDRPRRALVAGRARHGLHGVLWLALFGLFVVCHGCHGDEDNELSAAEHRAHRENTTDNHPANRLRQPQPVRQVWLAALWDSDDE